MKNMNKIMMILVAILAITTAMTPVWGQTTSSEFAKCYDCQRNPAYPKKNQSCNLSGFTTPYVGYNGGVGTQSGNTTEGPWKVVYKGKYSSTNTYNCSSVVSSVVNNYSGLQQTDVPIYELQQWNGSEYKHAAYGVMCAYSNVNNSSDHTALFVAEGGWGCFLTGNVHTSGFSVTFDADVSTGFPELSENYTLTLNVSPQNTGTVTANATSGISGNNPYTVNPNTSVSIEATASTGYHFVNWDDNVTTNPRSITVTSNVTRTANFAINTYTLQLNKNINNAGTVTATATSGISGNNPYTVNHNTSVSIQATASTGYRFVNWDDNVATNPRSITVTSNVTRTANFVREYTITLSTNNNYGTVSITGTGVVDKGNGQYAVPEGNTITITATPNTGSHFVNWDGNQTLTNPTRQITVSSNQTITANFDYKIYNMPSQWTVKANNESVNVTSGTTDGIQDGKTVKITPALGQKILTVKVKNKTN